MATRTGSSNIYLKIKDKTLKLEERLNLLRYAWKFSNVYIPNKEQVLVDILTGFLLNQKKERLNKDDVDNIWKCLQDVLQTRKASEPNKILLRQSSTQMLIDSLLAADENTGYLLPLIGCFEAIMKSDSLSAVFTHRLESMVLILEGFCGILTMNSCKHVESLSSAVNHTVDRFNEALKTAPGQNQILTKVCDLVLPKFLGLWSRKPPENVEKISTAVLQVLSHRDHHQSYDVYLKAKHSTAGGHIHKKAKPVENLFSTLTRLLKTTEESCSLYLPVVFENYIKQNCHKGIQLTVHYLIVEFCSMIGLRSDNNDLSGPIRSSVVFRTVHELLKIIQGRELYEQFLDEKNELVQLKFYKHIVHVLTDFKQSIDDERDVLFSDWYSILTIFIEMNHYIVEMKLVEILSVGWINTKVKEEEIEALDNMLCELMTTYSKLRQVPKLILKVIGTLCICDGSTPLQLTPRFQICYGEVVQNLPQGTMLDVWKKFAASLKGLFISDDTKHDTGHFQGICLLFHHFLLNVKVADYTVTELTLKSVQDLLVVMETEILAPLLKETLENKDMSKLKHTLFLSQAWGEVVAMLALYTKYRSSEFQTKALVLHEGDLSYVHGYLETKQWMRLYKIVNEHTDHSLLYVWETLMMQKVRTVLVFRGVTDWSMMTDTMATFINHLRDADVSQDNTSWKGRLEEVTKASLLTARWRLLTTNIAAIYSVLSDEQIKIIADFIVKCMVICEPFHSKKDFNLRDISIKLLETTVVRESGRLLSSLVSSVWTNCGILFTGGNLKSPKKKKHDRITTKVSSLMDILGDSDISWPQQIDSETTEKLKEASEVLAVIWNSTESVHLADPNKLQACIRTLHYLPLEYMWSCDQIRCFTGLLAVKCLTEKFENQSKTENLKSLSSDCIEMCTFTLESSGLVPVFDIINAESFLDWLQNLLHSTTVVTLQGSPEHYKCLVLAEVTCQALVRDHASVEKLSSIVDKLCQEIKESQGSESLTLTFFLLQEISKLLSKPFLKDTIQDLCKTMFKSLSKSVLKLSPLLESSTRSHTGAVLLRTYAVILTTMQKTEKIQKSFVEKFPKMFLWCETTLLNMDTTEVYTVLSALIFLQTMSKHHTLLKLQLNIEDKLRIWKLLTNVLKDLLTQSTDEQSQSVNKSMDTENQSNIQNMIQSADNLTEKETQNRKSLKKKRKSENNLENQSNKSVSHDNATVDNLENQMTIISKLLQRSSEFFGTSEKVDEVNNRLVAPKESSTFEINDAVLNPTMLTSLCRSLMFEGQLESQRVKVIKMYIQSVMAVLLLTFDLEQFKEVLQDLVDSVDPGLLYKDRGRIQSAVYIWRHLIKLEFSDDQNKVIKYSAKDMMLNFQCMIQELKYIQSDDAVIDLTIPILHAQQEMLTAGMKFLASRNSILCIYSCLYSPLRGRTYFPAFNAVYSVLDTLLVHHCDTVFQNIPSFLGCAKRLLISVVEESNQDIISQQPDVIKQLMSCAYHMERLFSLISTHKVEFGKVAMYVVSDYVTAVQKVTLLPAIKRALVPAVYKMLDLCDKHAISQLHVVLSHGVTEVFRLLYKEYKKFHKYQGKI